jgi:hypothetical protein
MHRSRLNRNIAYFVLAAVMAGFVALAGCTMVGDSQTGVGLTAFKVASCIKKCDKKNASAIKKENKRHENAVKKCSKVTKNNTDPTACLAAEDALHNQKLAAIDANYNACLNFCHKQGGN